MKKTYPDVENEHFEKDLKPEKVENFSLTLDYEDPFLKSSVSKKYIPKKRIPRKAHNTASKAPILKCIYLGCMKKDKRNLAILRHDSRDLILYQNQEKEGIEILKVFEDSVMVKYSGHDYIFYKGQGL